MIHVTPYGLAGTGLRPLPGNGNEDSGGVELGALPENTGSIVKNLLHLPTGAWTPFSVVKAALLPNPVQIAKTLHDAKRARKKGRVAELFAGAAANRAEADRVRGLIQRTADRIAALEIRAQGTDAEGNQDAQDYLAVALDLVQESKDAEAEAMASAGHDDLPTDQVLEEVQAIDGILRDAEATIRQLLTWADNAIRDQHVVNAQVAARDAEVEAVFQEEARTRGLVPAGGASGMGDWGPPPASRSGSLKGWLETFVLGQDDDEAALEGAPTEDEMEAVSQRLRRKLGLPGGGTNGVGLGRSVESGPFGFDVDPNAAASFVTDVVRNRGVSVGSVVRRVTVRSQITPDVSYTPGAAQPTESSGGGFSTWFVREVVKPEVAVDTAVGRGTFRPYGEPTHNYLAVAGVGLGVAGVTLGALVLKGLVATFSRKKNPPRSRARRRSPRPARARRVSRRRSVAA